MNDCSNAEIRDKLPDLLHDRLAVSVRAIVVAHVAGCVDCHEELELLRGVHGVLVTQAPQVDVAWIVSALPRPAVARPFPARSRPSPVRRMMHLDWRIAAAVAFLSVGGSSVALLNRGPSIGGAAVPDTAIAAPVASVASISSSSQDASAPTDGSDEAVAVAQAAIDVSPDGRFADLSEAQLQSLLGDIGQLSAVPVTEPTPVVIQVVSTASPAPEGS